MSMEFHETYYGTLRRRRIVEDVRIDLNRLEMETLLPVNLKVENELETMLLTNLVEQYCLNETVTKVQRKMGCWTCHGNTRENKDYAAGRMEVVFLGRELSSSDSLLNGDDLADNMACLELTLDLLGHSDNFSSQMFSPICMM
eukprot:scaffold30456_cov66-Cyclotella_meneghiniana.AAC.3